jgi:hypothetical protein
MAGSQPRAVSLPAAFAPLLRLRRWCAWRLEEVRSGRWQKVPYLGLEWRASTNKPQLWLPYETADTLAATFEGMGFQAGVGVLLGAMPGGHDRLLCLDLDAARDPDTGTMPPWAEELLRRFPSFVETSPSGRGLHVLLTTTDDDLATAGLIRADGSARNQAWKQPALDGGKAPGVDLLVTGYVTVTGNALAGCGGRIARAPVDALRWLAGELGPSLTGTPPPALAPPVSRAATAAAERATSAANAPGLRISPSRLARLACELGDAEFQMLACLWLHARKGPRGMWQVSVSEAELCRLPGARQGTSRCPAAMRDADAALVKRGYVRVVQARRAPWKGRPGTATVREVIAPFVHDARAGPPPQLVRIPRAIWARMLALPPRPLRVLAWIIGSLWGSDEGELSFAAAGRALGVKGERIAEFTEELVADGWLIQLARPDASAGRPGRYRLGDWKD